MDHYFVVEKDWYGGIIRILGEYDIWREAVLVWENNSTPKNNINLLTVSIHSNRYHMLHDVWDILKGDFK
jgi:hypothetical protein